MISGTMVRIKNNLQLPPSVRAISLVCMFTAFYCFAALLYPYSGRSGVLPGVMILVLFICLFCIAYLVTSSLFSGWGGVGMEWAGTTICWALFLSVLGISFILLDRIYYRGIDFVSMTPAEVRNKISAESTGGISSVFSVFGNILQCFVVVAGINSVARLKGRKLAISQVACLSVVLASSYLLGGRTPLLTYLVIMFSYYVLFHGLSGLLAYKKSIFFFVLLSVMFSVLIFKLRSDAVGLDSYGYLENMLKHLGAQDVGHGSIYTDSFFMDLVNYLMVVLAYLLHSFWVSSDIVYNSGGAGNISFSSVLFLISKVGVDFSLARHEYYELFASLPGGLYYDFGLLGVFLYSCLLGVLFAFSVFLLSLFDLMILKVFLVFVVSTLLLAPLLHSLNFPFYIFYMSILLLYALAFDFRCWMLRTFRKRSG